MHPGEAYETKSRIADDRAHSGVDTDRKCTKSIRSTTRRLCRVAYGNKRYL
jgi:hypothetical protein